MRSHRQDNPIRARRSSRRGVVAVFLAISLTALLGMAALTVDIGLLYSAQAEMQRTADASALASAWELLNEDRIRQPSLLTQVFNDSRDEAASLALLNPVVRTPTIVDPIEDVQIGYAADFSLFGADMIYNDPRSNAVVVTVRRDAARGGSIALYFGNLFGVSERDLQSTAIAGFADGITGFEITENTGNAMLLPFTLHVDVWNNYLAGAQSVGDGYTYDPDSGLVSVGGDGIAELNLYPGAGVDQLPPGNFGTVDIGSSNNSTADIVRQILYGVNEADLAYHGGTLELGADGTITLNGDTGLSAGFKDDLEAIKGEGRVIPLFDQVSGNGNNTNFRIVGFAGIRIVHVKLTGPMTLKELVIQKGNVVDGTGISTPNSGTSYNVFRPVQLVQ